MCNRSWEEHEINYLKENYTKMTNRQMAKVLGRTKCAVDLKINKLGIKKSKYTFNTCFFNCINTEEKAYWLGFISADGWIQYKNNPANYELGIQLQALDADHIKKFNKSIGGNIPIIFNTRVCNLNGKKYSQATLRLYSKEFIEPLLKFGLENGKSYDLAFPDLNSDFMRHYIRGYFDGDGCIGQNSNANRNIKIDFCSACKQYLDSLRAYLYTQGVSSYIVDKKNKNTYRLNIAGMKNVDKMMHYLYDDASIFLERKYVKYKHLYKKNDIEARLPRRIEICG